MAQLKISETQRTRAVILALLSTLSFSFMMIFGGSDSPEIPLWEQTFFRNLIGSSWQASSSPRPPAALR